MKEIHFFYKYTEVKGINLESIKGALKVSDAEEKIINLNRKIYEATIEVAREQQAKEINREYAQRRAEILKFKEEDRDAYEEQCVEEFWKKWIEVFETDDEKDKFAVLDGDHYINAIRGKENYAIDTKKLAQKLILQSLDDVKMSLILTS